MTWDSHYLIVLIPARLNPLGNSYLMCDILQWPRYLRRINLETVKAGSEGFYPNCVT